MRTIYSFGYKLNGEDQFATTGHNAPLIIDCRGLFNPHNSPELRKLTGRDHMVQRAVMGSQKAYNLLNQAIAHMIDNKDATVAFGCSYGKHRSVALAEVLGQVFQGAKVIHTGAASKGRYA